MLIVANIWLDDESDMKSKIGLLYGRSDMLIRKLYLCSSSVKKIDCSPLIAVIHISVFYGVNLLKLPLIINL